MPIVSALCLALLAANPGDVARIKVAIPAMHAEVGVPQGSANLLAELLTNDIQRSGRYEVINSSDIASLIGASRAQQLAGCAEDSCLGEIGNAIGANLLIAGNVGTIGDYRVLVLKLIDTRIGRVTKRVTETVHNDGELIGAGHRLLAQLLDLSELPAVSPRQVPAAALPSVQASSEPSTPSKRMAGWGVLAGGGALCIGGIVFGVMAQGDATSFQQQPTRADLSASAEGKARVADILYGGAIIAAGVATFLLLTSPPVPPPSTP